MDRLEKLRAYVSEKEGKILSANELAGILGVTISTITEAEKGNRKPSPKVARALKKKYDVSEEWYLTGKGFAPWELDSEVAGYLKYDETGQHGAALIDAAADILRSPQRDLVDRFIRAGRNPLYREALYNVLEESGILPLYQELLELKRELAGLRAAVPEPVTVSPPAVTPRKNIYQNKTAPAIRLTADQTFESTEVILKFPEKPIDIDQDQAARWDRNELALRRWEKTETARRQFPRGDVPAWALERFCREVVNFYEGGNLQDVGGLLLDFISESATQ